MARDIDARFAEDTKDHQLTVIRDEGLYRHLRCQRPGTYVYGFDIITWPGYLAYTGDMGCYVLSRTDDMFEFFGSGRINPDYWSEKVQAACSSGIREFSRERYEQCVREWLDGVVEDLDKDDGDWLAGEVEEQLLGARDLSDESAHRRLSEFHSDIATPGDAWEWDFNRFTARFIWACYAITWAIGQYRARGGDGQ